MPNTHTLSKTPSVENGCPETVPSNTSVTFAKRSTVQPIDSSLDSPKSQSEKKISPKGSRVTPIKSEAKAFNFGNVIHTESDSESTQQTNVISPPNSIKREKMLNFPSLELAQKHTTSILKKPRYVSTGKPLTVERTGRKDSSGRHIKKGSTSHKIKFREELEDVKMIENWKDYNYVGMADTHCTCNLF